MKQTQTLESLKQDVIAQIVAMKTKAEVRKVASSIKAKHELVTPTEPVLFLTAKEEAAVEEGLRDFEEGKYCSLEEAMEYWSVVARGEAKPR